MAAPMSVQVANQWARARDLASLSTPHGAPVQRRALPTAGQDRGHSSTAAGTSRQPADPNWQSQEDRSPAKETHAGLEPAESEAEALGGSRTGLGTTGRGGKSLTV